MKAGVVQEVDNCAMCGKENKADQIGVYFPKAKVGVVQEKWVALSVFAGIIAHIFGDMLTGKVKLFYPSSLSVGIPIPQMFFALIDRMAKIALLVVLVYFVWSDFLSELTINQYFRETVDNIPFF